MKKITSISDEYLAFIKNKAIVAEEFGFMPNYMPAIAKPHQRDICNWAIEGGRRAIFASFGLGKTFMQLIVAVNVIKETNKPFLIACPLGVVGEFKRDNIKIKTGYEIQYITDTDTIENYENKIYLTNYERIRKGDIDASKFGGVSFDEASILRNLKTETTNYILQYFKQLPYRFVATATPSPNDYIELLNYAEYLGVADRGHLLTRFFKRNSTKAGDLQLLETKEKEFWQWCSTWAAFVNKPSDLGYDDVGYDLPKLRVVKHIVNYTNQHLPTDKYGNPTFFKDVSKSLLDAAREKRDGIEARVLKAMAIIKDRQDNFILWHHLEDERKDLEFRLKGMDYRSVFGSQTNALKEKNLIDFSEGAFQYLITKPSIAGSGCNFQGYCSTAIFVGIDYKFNDFIQAVHRILRYGQEKQVTIHIILTENEQHVYKVLMEKWKKHEKLQREMISLVREYGLNSNLIQNIMQRQIFENGDKVQIGNATLYNNDNVLAIKEIAANSIDHIVTSIPFGDHYEYSDNYNDFGHNHGNGKFFEQMDYLTPELLRVMKPGHIAAIHVKDRIRYSYQNGTSFTTIDDFSGQTVAHFVKHGWYLMGKITVTTDVVAENNQTYRLGWTEQCKDATKMGVGLPEYILLFRKAPSEMNNAYADEKVSKTKEQYSVNTWQLDAHAYWRSSGNSLVKLERILQGDMKHIRTYYLKAQEEGIYDFKEHEYVCSELERSGKLSRKFMTIPPRSNNDAVWDDIKRTNTLNAKQVNKKKEKHICPLQLDIIERLINRFSNKGDVIFDPFGGLFSTAYQALKMGRKAVSIELNTDYYKDGLFYIHCINNEISAPKLFDVLEMEAV